MNKSALTAILAATTLAGCAAGPMKYNESHSEAYNIAQAGGLTQGIRDRTVPADQMSSLSDLALDGGWVASGFFNPQLGMSSWQTLGLHALGVAVEPEKQGARNSMIAWMPKSMAATPYEARDVLREQVKETVAKTMEELGATSRVVIDRIDSHDQGTIVIAYEKPEWNCTGETQEQVCMVRAVVYPPREGNAPDFISDKESSAYRFTANHAYKYNRFELHTVKNSVTEAPEAEIITALSKNLPEWVYLYTAPNQVSIKGGGEKIAFPFILNQGAMKLFVTPE